MADSDTTEPTLEELASKFEIQSPPVQRESSQELPKFDTPEQKVDWLVSKHSETEAQLRSVTENMTKRERDEYTKSLTVALDDAIKIVGDGIDLDPTFVEGFLHTTYNRDPAFQKIFDNRDQNPVAYKKALSVLQERLKAKGAVQQDPQIAENKRALEQLQKSARTGSQSKEEVSQNMSAAEFDNYWDKLKSG